MKSYELNVSCSTEARGVHQNGKLSFVNFYACAKGQKFHYDQKKAELYVGRWLCRASNISLNQSRAIRIRGHCNITNSVETLKVQNVCDLIICLLTSMHVHIQDAYNSSSLGARQIVSNSHFVIANTRTLNR